MTQTICGEKFLLLKPYLYRAAFTFLLVATPLAFFAGGAVPAHGQLFEARPLHLYQTPRTPPPIFLKDAQQNTLTAEAFKGQVVLLNFWATWCGPCVIEMPDLNALQRKYRKAGLQVVAVSLDENGFEATLPFYDEHNLDHLAAYTPHNTPLAEAYGVSTLPASFLINRRGQLIGQVKGFTNWQTPALEQHIQKALKEDSPTAQNNVPFFKTRTIKNILAPTP